MDTNDPELWEEAQAKYRFGFTGASITLGFAAAPLLAPLGLLGGGAAFGSVMGGADAYAMGGNFRQVAGQAGIGGLIGAGTGLLMGGVFRGVGFGVSRAYYSAGVQSFLRSGSHGGFRRNMLAWQINKFRLNSTRFYHGTTAESAASIQANGIDLAAARLGTLDFGLGFYTSQSLAHARSMAIRAAKLHGGSSAVVAFRVGNRQLSRLNSLGFNSADVAWRRFVMHNRGGGAMHSFDVVHGPTVGNLKSFDALPFPAYNQTSLHTSRAAMLFNQNLSRIF